ncbi:MAG: tRNA (adenosine(37)-N6)-threonylcarbamoyltransferase complex ATPase subunit type 1 TsaE [Pelolinea sp.]|jgi:tRNA threonylcarbamoyladenosine biosynthesis protein TsaE|nr:tRNA (adenosine(37)-N6)-threonylcarbamoyltransferase complex ATPase subunit type 1 TsaE [Pelolinea sp.]
MPILDESTLEFLSRSPDQTRRVGARLGSLLHSGDTLCLNGDLGAGKTTLVQGIAQGWGSADPVTSPTFVLVNHYRRPDGQQISHLDAYRLSGALEAEDLDLEYMLENGPLIVEWPLRIMSALPEMHLWIDLQYINEQQRMLLIKPAGSTYKNIVLQLRKQVFSDLT